MAAIDDALVGVRARTRADARAHSLTALFVGAAAVLYVVALAVPTVPTTMPDELVYGGLARTFGASGHFGLFGIPFPVASYSPLYVVLLGPIFRALPAAPGAYEAARALNAALFASAVFPVYWIARRMLVHRTALLIAAASVALPAAVFVARLQSENLAYPLFFVVALALLRVGERPAAGRQLLVALSLAALVAARFEFVALAPVVTLLALRWADGPWGRRLRTLAPLFAGLAVVGAAAVAAVVATRSSAGGSHGSQAGSLSLVSVVHWAFGTVAALDLYTGVLPLAVLIVALVRKGDTPLRRLAELAAIAGVALVGISSLYMASIPGFAAPKVPVERYVYYVVPLVLIVFARWLQDGVRLSRRDTAIVAAAAVLPVVAAIWLVHGGIAVGNSNAFGFLPWIYVRAITPHFWWLALAAFCAFVAVRAHRSSSVHDVLKPVVTLLFLTTIVAFFFVVSGARSIAAAAPPAGWLDRSGDGRAVALWGVHQHPGRWTAFWSIALGNEDLREVYYLRRPDDIGQNLERRAVLDGAGVVDVGGRPLAARRVLTTGDVKIAGRVLARSHGFVLYAVPGSVRVSKP